MDYIKDKAEHIDESKKKLFPFEKTNFHTVNVIHHNHFEQLKEMR